MKNSFQSKTPLQSLSLFFVPILFIAFLVIAGIASLASLALIVAADLPTTVKERGITELDSPLITFSNKSDINRSNVDHTFVNQIPDPVEPGEYVELRWKVENFGSTKTENIWVELLPEHPFSLLPGDSAAKKIGSLNGRQIGEKGIIVFWKLKVDLDAVEGDNQIRLRYSADNGKSWITLDPYLVRIRTRDAILLIESALARPASIRPGEASAVSITLHNLADSPLRNIRATLDLKGTPLVPLDSSNEKAIAILDRRSFSQLNFTLAAESDAKAGIVKIPVFLNYDDNSGTHYERNATIGLRIGDIPDLSVTLDSSEIKSGKSKGTVAVRIVNRGVTDIKFLSIYLEPDTAVTLLSSPEVYVGHIDSDDYETAEFDLYVGAAQKQVALPLHLVYKDANNKAYTQDILVPLTLYSTSELKKLGFKKSNPLIGILIVLALAAAGVYAYRKRKK